MGMHCEGGVKETSRGPASLGGECLSVSEEKLDANPATIGSAVWVTDYAQKLSLRSVDKRSYTLHLNEQKVGTITQDGNWIVVTFSAAPEGSGTLIGHGYGLRSDAPDPFI